MGTQMEDTVKGIKNIEREMIAWKSRKDGLVSEIESLKLVKVQMEKDIQAMKNSATQDVAQKLLRSRQDQAILDEARHKLESDKKEFSAIIQAFQKEKDVTADMKRDLEGVKKSYQVQFESVKAFILLVKREAEKL